MDLATGLQHPDGPIGSDHPVLTRKSGARGSGLLEQLEHPLAIGCPSISAAGRPSSRSAAAFQVVTVRSAATL